MRIAVGCIGHETNSFSPVPTTMAHFEQGSYYAGPAVLDAFAGTSTITGGFIDGAGDLGVELVPLLWTFATPSGVVEQATYDSLKARFMQLLQEAGPLDGVCLDLHGAMVSEAHEDAEGDLLASVRRAIGPMPLISTLDLHANITACMAAQVEALVGFDTYPPRRLLRARPGDHKADARPGRGAHPVDPGVPAIAFADGAAGPVHHARAHAAGAGKVARH